MSRTKKIAKAIAVGSMLLASPACEPHTKAAPRIALRPRKALPPKKKSVDFFPMYASMAVANGGMIADMLRSDKDGKFTLLESMKADLAKMKPCVDCSRTSGKAILAIAGEMRILHKVALDRRLFPRSDGFKAALASVFHNCGNIRLLYNNGGAHDRRILKAYLRKIRSLSSKGFADAAENWMKNGKGDRILLYNSMKVQIIGLK